MGELEEKLNAVLGDPQAMSQIMALAQSLGGPASAPSEQAAPAPKAEPPSAGPDLSSLLEGLSGGGLDPRLMQVAFRVMNDPRANNDERVALLQALRPFVRERRYAKLDKAIQIARLARLIRIALDTFKGGDKDRV